MGHIDVKGLKRATTGLPIDAVTVTNCQICALANIKRLPFPRRSHTRADRPLFRIHCDICGPLPLGYSQFKYFILFIDDHSRYIWIFFLKLKSDALKSFDEFRLATERYLGQPLSVLRVDNAPELIAGRFEFYCNTIGITYEKPVPDAHQQNGVAERSIQTVEFMLRAMLVDANLSHWFWPLAAQAGVHIKNRIPHSSLPTNTTPFESILKKRADLSHIRPFGALVTSRKTNSDTLNKVSTRGEEGRFVGYARDSKGYLIYFPHSRAIRVRRDVQFHGFPVTLPSPPPSEVLWDDIPFELEKRFRDAERGGERFKSPQDGVINPQDGTITR